ncbi:MAG TPA: serine/threonine-protein kinase [Kofleriaceae bacterium]|nr:serine/threonine-protein kinase [Kofleriaceae bacterium]
MEIEAGPGRGATLGGYEVLYQLKAGGMGEVLLARKRGPSGFERLVALKTMRSELRARDELRRMFLDEAQLLARLSHPAIAQIHDFGEDRGVLYLAMEYVAGVRFRDLVEDSPPPAAVSARAMAEVCRALHAAHELRDLSGHALGVVHRDVSPDNLMLTFGGQVKVLDFGIALMRGRQAPVTEYGTIKGKPPYLSPEQIKNQAVDRRTDVFAASAVLHEMLTGAQLFTGDSVYAIVRAIEHDEVAPPSRAAGSLPPGLDHAVMRGLERDPDRRWQSADELAGALDQVVAAADGEALAVYAARHLGDEERRHREWLRSVLEPPEGRSDGGAGPARSGRASGIVTAQAPAAAEVFDPDAPTLGSGRVRRGRRARVAAIAAVAAVAALAVGGIAAAGLGLWSSGPEREPPQGVRGRVGSAAEPGAADLGAADRRAADPRAAAPDASPPVAIAAAPPDAGPRVDPSRVDPPDRSSHDTRRSSGSRTVRAASRSSSRRAAAAGSTAAPVAPTAAPAAPTGTGTITVVTRPGAPWAQVFIDGQYVDDTPIMKREIPAGDHVVVFKNAATKQERDRRSVHVAADQHVEIVER